MFLNKRKLKQKTKKDEKFKTSRCMAWGPGYVNVSKSLTKTVEVVITEYIVTYRYTLTLLAVQWV